MSLLMTLSLWVWSAWAAPSLGADADAQRVLARLADAQALAGQRIATRPPVISAEAWVRAARGDVVTGVTRVPGEAAKMGWGVAVIDAPIDRLWWGLNEELFHQELLHLGHVEIVVGAPCADRRRVMMLLPLPLVADRWWVVENRYNTPLSDQTGGRVRELRWESVPDPLAEPLSESARSAVDGAIPVAFNRGAWLLIDLDGERTLAEYHSFSDPGGDLPAGAASSFANASIADTIEKMGRYAKTAPVRCPGGR